MSRLPPALAARATERVIELLGPPAGPVLELGFAGIHAAPLRLAGFEVDVVEPDPAHRARALERAGEPVYETLPGRWYDAVVAPEGTDPTGIRAARRFIVRRDGTVRVD
jgi:hypothetical protein